MASFRTGIKISSVFVLPKRQRYAGLLQQNPMSTVEHDKEPKPGPGPNPRKILTKHRCLTCGQKGSLRPEPRDGSPSKCLEVGYGKPLPKPKRPWFNFCKIPVEKKNKPCDPPQSTVVECKQQSFWDYLFNFDTKPRPHPSTCRMAYNKKQECKLEDIRLRDSRYAATKGDVLIFTEAPKPEVCSGTEPQPRPPPSYRPPKAVTCKRIADAASLPAYMCNVCPPKDDFAKKCCNPKPYRPPYDEFRPDRKSRKPFSYKDGISADNVAPPMRSVGPSSCGGRTIEEYEAERTLPKKKPLPAPSVLLNEACNPHATIKKSSRYQQLQKLTKAATGGKCPPSPAPLPEPQSSPCCNTSCKMSTSAGSSSRTKSLHGLNGQERGRVVR